ncbi:FadR/GntR family transcriptional regulator [Actinomadura rupiterrae]|uniref:FadR/GntR family transcriptional regulator n=1 Tax=Actinomadura rupiterrae TaxID=559627 RepID=UPI0020A4C824|nr:FCD domain-containing protein [Actinomadura rupiterrae]MCP2335757.1 DNA-binding FadR family transcriptional regulator [Actinomadura rupiterrae]
MAPRATLREDRDGPGERRPPGRAEEAAARVTELLARLEPGARLGTKEQVRTACGVSVGTFNVTLRLLQERGLVTVRPGPGGGLFAPDGSAPAPAARTGTGGDGEVDAQAALADAFRVREAIEPLIIEDALWYGSPADFAELRALTGEMGEAAGRLDGPAYVRAAWRFHARLAAISPGPLLRDCYLRSQEVIEARTPKIMPEGEPEEGFMRRRHELHAALVDALDARDREAVARLLREHDAG